MFVLVQTRWYPRLLVFYENLQDGLSINKRLPLWMGCQNNGKYPENPEI